MRYLLLSTFLILGCSGGSRPAPAAPPVPVPELTRDECEEGIGHQDYLLQKEQPLSPESIDPLIEERARDHDRMVDDCVKTGTRAQYDCVMQSETIGGCEDPGPF